MPDSSSSSRRISWAGVSFLVPVNWELTVYKFLRGGVTRIEIEDEYSVRMEAEWLKAGTRLQMDNIMERYERSSGEFTAKADHKEQVNGLPKGWFATQHVFKETVPEKKGLGRLKVVRHDLVTAFFVSPDSRLFCYVLLHFLPFDCEKPQEITRLVASEFRHHLDDALVPWKLFDIEFETPKEFVLESTKFDIGAKMMVFRWRLRRFYIWFYSCADMFLKDGVVMEKWVAGQLNGYSGIRGPVFRVGEDGRVAWKRRGRHLVGHADEITRWCFKYKICCHRDTARNHLVVWVFSYRKEEDLDVIPNSLRFQTRSDRSAG